MRVGRGAPLAAITVDVHGSDLPSDITHAAEWLASRGLAATFFIPSSILSIARYRECCRRLLALNHEAASHGHTHGVDEMRALAFGTTADLAFLARSKCTHEDFFGHSPVSFRSPAWCKLGDHAVSELHRLGYRVDSSATPGRWAILSSLPFYPTWPNSFRAIRPLRATLWEVPTSTLLVPAGSPTFLTLRKRWAVPFVRLLEMEARACANRAVVVQFHADEFDPHRRDRVSSPLSVHDWAVAAVGGLRVKHALRATRSTDIAATTEAIIESLSGCRFRTLARVSEEQVP